MFFSHVFLRTLERRSFSKRLKGKADLLIGAAGLDLFDDRVRQQIESDPATTLFEYFRGMVEIDVSVLPRIMDPFRYVEICISVREGILNHVLHRLGDSMRVHLFKEVVSGVEEFINVVRLLC